MTKEQLEEFEKYDKLKTKVLKYALYKKRSEYEIRQKFRSEIEENMLEDIIEELKSNSYISDENYVERAVNEFIALNKLSIKEIKYKLCTKGIKNDLIDTYISEHYEELYQFEIDSARKIVLKKMQDYTEDEVKIFLLKKGYSTESIKIALED